MFDYFRSTCLVYPELVNINLTNLHLSLLYWGSKCRYIVYVLYIFLSVCFLCIISLPTPVVYVLPSIMKEYSCLIFSFGVWVMLMFVLSSSSVSLPTLLENLVTTFSVLKIKLAWSQYKTQQSLCRWRLRGTVKAPDCNILKLHTMSLTQTVAAKQITNPGCSLTSMVRREKKNSNCNFERQSLLYPVDTHRNIAFSPSF